MKIYGTLEKSLKFGYDQETKAKMMGEKCEMSGGESSRLNEWMARSVVSERFVWSKM